MAGTTDMPSVRSGSTRVLPTEEARPDHMHALVDLRTRCIADNPDAAASIDRLSAELDANGQEPWVATHGSSAVVGKACSKRLQTRIGYLRLPTPRLRTLSINGVTGVYGVNETSATNLTADLADFINAGTFDCCVINRLRDDTTFGKSIAALATSQRIVSRSSMAWQCDLVDSTGCKAFPLKGKTRRKRRNGCRRLADALVPVSVEVASRASDVDTFLDAAEHITTASYHRSLGVGVRSSVLWRNILLTEAVNQRLRCYLLRVDDSAIAYVFGIVDNCGAYHFEATSFDPAYREHSPGSVLLWHVINDLFDNQVVVRVDFGFGDAAYKRIYATRQFRESTIHLFGRSTRAQCASTLVRTTQLLHDRCAAMPLAQSAKRQWRMLMTRRPQGVGQ